jgi:hypothetical protein
MANDEMTENLGARRRIANWLTVIGKWWVLLIAGLFALGTAVAMIIFLIRFLTGNPEWAGIVMFPEVLVFAILLCLPGAAIFAVGRLFKSRN